MEEAGVKLDCEVLAGISVRLDARFPRQGARNLREGRRRVQHQLAQTAWQRVLQQLNLPKPIKHGKGKTISTADDVLEALASEHDVPRHRARLPPALEAEVDLCRCAAGLLNPEPAACTPLQQGGIGDGRLSSVNPNLQNIPIRTELGREIRAAFIAEPERPAHG